MNPKLTGQKGEVQVYSPCCKRCDAYLQLEGSHPQKVGQKTLYPGILYCKGGKNIREFRKRDPKTRPASWCPRYKNPAELKIYGFKDEDAENFIYFLRSYDLIHIPSESQYSLRLKGVTSLSAKGFQEHAKLNSVAVSKFWVLM